jgi:hypothetical protein
MRYLYQLLVLASVLLLSACGGGDGCAGAPPGSPPAGCNAAASTTPTPPGTTTAASAVGLVITDSAGATLPFYAITSGSVFYAQATLVTATGTPIANQIVSFSTDTTVGTLSGSSALTNASGVARVQISPASLTVTAAAMLTATSTVAGATVTNSIGYQTGASNVGLGAVVVTPGTISALQTASVSVPVTVNGVAASPGMVSVTLSPTCGYFTAVGVPNVTVPTSSGGVASATWHSQSICGGATVGFTASAPSATSTNGSVVVTVVQPANIVYTGATAQTLVVSSASSGTKQSTVSFQVVDSAAPPAGMASQSVTISLNSQAVSAGVKFNVSGTLTSANQVVNTDSSGVASVTIQSSTFPTPVSVTAYLTAIPTMTASSSGMVVTAGAPSQSYTSVGPLHPNIAGLEHDGVSTTVTLRTADRQGNPVPPGTVATFITNSGTITPGSCSTDASSACTVTYTTSGTKPTDGVVTVLAYLPGEESFSDLNGNNVWDAGEPFQDMGQAFRDDNHNGVYDALTDQAVGTATGATSPCPTAPAAAAAAAYPSIANTCDNTWTSAILVRKATQIRLTSDSARITYVGATNTVATFTVDDQNIPGGPVAYGTTISATVSSNPPTTTPATPACALVSVTPTSVADTSTATTVKVNLNGSPACSAGAPNATTVTVTVTPPGVAATSLTQTLP